MTEASRSRHSRSSAWALAAALAAAAVGTAGAAGPPSGAVSAIPAFVTALSLPDVADAGTRTQARIQVTDAMGQAAAGVRVTLTAAPEQDAGATQTVATATTDNDGMATLSWKPAHVGMIQVVMTAAAGSARGRHAATASSMMTVYPPGTNLARLPAAVRIGPLAQRLGSRAPLVATAFAEDGQALGGATLEITPSTGSGSARGIRVRTDAAGSASLRVRVRTPRLVWLQSIAPVKGLSAGDTPVLVQSDAPLVVLPAAESAAMVPADLTVTVAPATVTQGRRATVAVHVVNASGVAVPGARVWLSASATKVCGVVAPCPPGGGSAVLVPASGVVTTDRDGTAEATLVGGHAGALSVFAQAAAPGLGQSGDSTASGSAPWNVLAAAARVPSRIELTPSAAVVTAGGTAHVTVRVLDAAGRPVPDAPVWMTVPAGGGCGGGPGTYQVPAGDAVLARTGVLRTDAEGVVTDTLRATVPGQVLIPVAAAAPGLEPQAAPMAQQTLQLLVLPRGYAPDRVPSRIALRSAVVPGGVDVTVAVVNASGRPVAGAPVTLNLPMSPTAPLAWVATAETVFTGSDGLARIDVRGPGAGRTTGTVQTAPPGLDLDPAAGVVQAAWRP